MNRILEFALLCCTFCAPLLYQTWLLVIEYQHGVTPLIYMRPEPFTDLPAVTVCIPLKFSIKRSTADSLIKALANKSRDDNPCSEYAETLQRVGHQNVTFDVNYWLFTQYEDCHLRGAILDEVTVNMLQN